MWQVGIVVQYNFYGCWNGCCNGFYRMCWGLPEYDPGGERIHERRFGRWRLWYLVWVVLRLYWLILGYVQVLGIGNGTICIIIAGLGVEGVTGVIPWEGYFGVGAYVH